MAALQGTRLKDRRIALGLRQAAVAEAAGMSASYLNLIEHNRRKVGPEVLDRLARALDWPQEAFAEIADTSLIDAIRMASTRVAQTTPEMDRIQDFAAKFPGWAGVIAALGAQNTGLERGLQSLNDRISHDPHLSASLHEVLSAISSVRTTAAILADTEDIDPDWRKRFHHNLHQDSERLALGAQALVAYLDGANGLEEHATASPQEEAEAWAASLNWDLNIDDDALQGFTSSAARNTALSWCRQARQDAEKLPQDALLRALDQWGPDPVRLAKEFGCDVLTAMRRIAVRPGSGAGLVICDAAGALTFRKPIESFDLPRYGSACALWPLFTALGQVMCPVEAHAVTVAPVPYRVCLRAFSQPRFPTGFSGPSLREAGMLILPQTEPVDGDFLELGVSCRICVKSDCPARTEASILTR